MTKHIFRYKGKHWYLGGHQSPKLSHFAPKLIVYILYKGYTIFSYGVFKYTSQLWFMQDKSQDFYSMECFSTCYRVPFLFPGTNIGYIYK